MRPAKALWYRGREGGAMGLEVEDAIAVSLGSDCGGGRMARGGRVLMFVWWREA